MGLFEIQRECSRTASERGDPQWHIELMTPGHEGGGGVRENYRTLTRREREILEMLLSVDGPGFAELRAQTQYVEAARWACGCASFDLRVDRERAPRSSIIATPAVEAMTRERDDVNGTFDLLLWVDDGWLAGVEIVDYVDRHGEESPDEIPPRDAWGKPQVYVA